MFNFLRKYSTQESYNQSIGNVTTRPLCCYIEENQTLTYHPIVLRIVCNDNIEDDKYQVEALYNGVNVTSSTTWSTNSNLVTINSAGLMTISSGVTSLPVTITAAYKYRIVNKNVIVT